MWAWELELVCVRGQGEEEVGDARAGAAAEPGGEDVQGQRSQAEPPRLRDTDQPRQPRQDGAGPALWGHPPAR